MFLTLALVLYIAQENKSAFLSQPSLHSTESVTDLDTPGSSQDTGRPLPYMDLLAVRSSEREVESREHPQAPQSTETRISTLLNFLSLIHSTR